MANKIQLLKSVSQTAFLQSKQFTFLHFFSINLFSLELPYIYLSQMKASFMLE